MAYKRKTKDEWQILANYGYGHGWEEVCAEDSYREARDRIREYRDNEPQYRHKIKCVRVPLEA